MAFISTLDAASPGLKNGAPERSVVFVAELRSMTEKKFRERPETATERQISAPKRGTEMFLNCRSNRDFVVPFVVEDSIAFGLVESAPPEHVSPWLPVPRGTIA